MKISLRYEIEVDETKDIKGALGPVIAQLQPLLGDLQSLGETLKQVLPGLAGLVTVKVSVDKNENPQPNGVSWPTQQT